MWDTSEIITIDNGYKTAKYEIKCVKHGYADLCACQSNNYGPIYECQRTVHEPYNKGMIFILRDIVTVHTNYIYFTT